MNVLRLLKPRWKRDVEVGGAYAEEEELEEVIQAEEDEGVEDVLEEREEALPDSEAELVSAVVVEGANRPSPAVIERFAMVCFLEEIDHAQMPLDPASFEIFRGCLERLQGMARLEACVLCWEALAKVGVE